MLSDGDYLLTPQGYRHRSLLNTVKGGARIRKTENSWRKLSSIGHLLGETFKSTELIIGAGTPPATGWVSYAETKNTSGTPVSVFETTWTVPAAPKTNSGQLIYLFNALQNTAQDHILQPVLQWGNSPAPNSGNFWAVASWWVGQTNDQFFITELVPVNIGDVLVGRITMNWSNANLFAYTCEFVGIHGTKITAENLPELTDCTETLEAYDITSIDDYPATNFTAFTQIRVQTGGIPAPLSWTAAGTFPPKLVDNSTSGGEVDIIYPTSQITQQAR
jgi:hypothetical protein